MAEQRYVRFGTYTVRFMPHPKMERVDPEAVQGHLTTKSGYVLSIVGGSEGFLYGNGRTTFEVLLMDSNGNDVWEEGVREWQSVEDIAEIVRELDGE